MKIEFENNLLDLGTTPIENMFINTFLSRANDVQIKVYLYALSHGYSEKEDLTNENIAREMSLTEGQVVDAWDYWINEGIVEKKEDRYIFKSVRMKYLNEIYNLGLEDTPTVDHTSINKIDLYDPSPEAEESRRLIETIENFVGQQLDSREVKVVLKVMNDFNVSPDYISYAYMTAASIREMKSVDPVMATIRNWLIDGKDTPEKIDAQLMNMTESKSSSKSNESSSVKISHAKTSKNVKLADKDNRMTKEERLRYVQEKMNKKIPIVKRKDR